MDLVTTTSAVADATVLRVRGAADITTISRLDAALRRAVASLATPRLVVDLDELTVIDELALGSILGAAARARAVGATLEIVSTTERVLALLRSTRVDEIVDVRPSIVTA